MFCVNSIPQRLPMRILLFSCLFSMPLCSIIFGIHITLVSGECLSDGRVCLEDEMSLLLRLKKTLKFNVAVSNKLVSWNRSADCSSWGGVTWDANGHVVGLDLSSESISGGFNSSSSLFSLQYLQSLNLAGNSFCGGLNWPNNSFCSSQIPSGFDRLANLIYLNLSNSGFSGQIPKEFSLLTSLVTIDFSSLGYLIGFPTLKLQNPNLRMLVQNIKELRELHLNGVDNQPRGRSGARHCHLQCLISKCLACPAVIFQAQSILPCRSFDLSQGFVWMTTILLLQFHSSSLASQI